MPTSPPNSKPACTRSTCRPRSRRALLDYLALLDRWNRTYNLTAIRDPREMLRRAPARLAGDARLRDRRAASPTSAPAPACPASRWRSRIRRCRSALVESNGKKARFLREAVRTLGLGNARVLESRAEAVAEPGAYDAITARALDRLAGIIAVGGHLLSPAGACWR